MEILTESSSISPRISFSYDLGLFETVPVEQRHLRSDSSGVSSGFEFDLGTGHESRPADELFSGGKIIPGEIKKKKKNPSSPQLPAGEKQIPEQSVRQRNETEDQKPNPNPSSKSFWRFKRSSSLNCGSGYGSKLCPLPLMSRSNSTGSAEVPSTKHHHHPPPSPPPSLKPTQARVSHQSQRPPLRRSSMKVNPALNVHSGNLFGLGSIIFNGGKDSKNRRK